MSRPITFTRIAHRRFDDVCWILERRADDFLRVANSSASRRAVTLVAQAEQEIPHFDAGGPLVVEVCDVHRTRTNELTLELRWSGDGQRRFLPNVEAHVTCAPVVGAPATTQLTVGATHTPSTATRHHRLVRTARRIVRGALDELLDSIVTQLENYEEDAFA